MGSRFLVSLLGTFLATLVILIGGGYAITQMTVRQPRDPFRTGSFEFDLAPGWWCELEDSEYVCTPPGQPPHPAIAVIAVKERSRGENLQAYEEHLKQPQKVSDRAGGTVLSEVSYVKRSRLGQVEWVEALQLGSEVPNYDTYYLATTTSSLGILVTMSVHKDHAATYVRQLTDMMRTLNVYQR
jgi:hypothetical protein